MSALKVVCLISGGKDSAFSILHCLANGHDVVALANLYPMPDANQDTPDDVDSYMYQTIGHAVIPHYEKAFGLPLYRQEIIGSAINQNKSYGPSAAADNDESESLIPLLLEVKAHHPEVNALSTGAILSDYQRTRVESVAIRLGLTSLSYLWHYPFLPPYSQTSLLEDMVAVGQDSRIIKVASGGLDDSFLWHNVAEARTISRLDKASRRFGAADDGAVLGEGGEYETLAVAGPAPLWKGRIVVKSDHRQVVMGEAGSASLRISSASLELDDTRDKPPQPVRIPPLFDPSFETILARLPNTTSAKTQLTEDQSSSSRKMMNSPEVSGCHIACESDLEIRSQTLLPSITGKGESAAEQMRSILEKANHCLQAQGCSFADVAYTSIILRDMKDFLAVNAAYGSSFQYANPPARITIACASVLPADKHLMVSFTITRSSSAKLRKGLHVQSRSYWAPANIGPYSQAISVPIEAVAEADVNELVYISGQIPLIPASMELPTSFDPRDGDSFIHQSVLALQHAVRVGNSMQVRDYLSTVVFIVASSTDLAISRSNTVHEVWRSFHCVHETVEMTSDGSDDPSFDVWNLQYGQAKSHAHGPNTLHAKETMSTDGARTVPSLYVIRVDALPRNASVEWVTYGVTKRMKASSSALHFHHLLDVFSDNIVST